MSPPSTPKIGDKVQYVPARREAPSAPTDSYEATVFRASGELLDLEIRNEPPRRLQPLNQSRVITRAGVRRGTPSDAGAAGHEFWFIAEAPQPSQPAAYPQGASRPGKAKPQST